MFNTTEVTVLTSIDIRSGCSKRSSRNIRSSRSILSMKSSSEHLAGVTAVREAHFQRIGP